MKKFLAVLLAVMMTLGLFAMTAQAEDVLTIIWWVSEETHQNNLKTNPTIFDPVWSVKEAFEQETGVKLNVIVGAWGDMLPTAITRVNNGEPVDIVQANDQSFPVYPARQIPDSL